MLRRVESISVAVLVLMALGGLVAARWSVVVYSPSPSVGHQLFVRAYRSPRVDDFVVFCAPPGVSRRLREHGYPSHPLCPDLRVRLVKRVEIVDDGWVFVRGVHPRSADSRIFGWIPTSEVFTVVPIDAPEGAFP